jgi:hypothetical protein
MILSDSHRFVFFYSEIVNTVPCLQTLVRLGALNLTYVGKRAGQYRMWVASGPYSICDGAVRIELEN